MQQLTIRVSTPETEKQVIHNYINKYFKSVKNCEDAIRQITKLDVLLQNCDYVLAPDILLELINTNKLFNKAVKLIYIRNNK